MHPEWINSFRINFTTLVSYVPVIATIVTTFFSIILARATLRYVEATDKGLQLAREEQHGLPFHARAQLLLQIEHAPRAGAERAVVQELDSRVQCPVPRQLDVQAPSLEKRSAADYGGG